MASEIKAYDSLTDGDEEPPPESERPGLFADLTLAGRVNLLVALGILALAAFAGIHLLGQVWLKQTLDGQLTHRGIERLVTSVANGGTRMRRWETDFFLRSDLKDAAAYEADAAKVLETLKTIENIPEVAPARIHIESLNEGLAQHVDQFKKVVESEKSLGLDNQDGLMGQLSAAARKFERGLELYGLETLSLKLSLMRGQERDFILHGGNRRLENIVEEGKAFFHLLVGTSLPESDKATIASLLDAYVTHALAFGETSLNQDAEIKRLGEIFAYMTPNMEALMDFAAQGSVIAQADVNRSRTAARYLTLTGSAVAAAILVIVGLMVARGIGRHITALADAAGSIASGARDITVPGQSHTDELGEVARALQALSDDLAQSEGLRRAQEAGLTALETKHEVAKVRIADELDAKVKNAAGSISATTAEIAESARALSCTVTENRQQFDAVTSAAERATSDIHEVAETTERLTEAISEVGRRVTRSSEIVSTAMTQTDRAGACVRTLVSEIGRVKDVVGFISDVAAETNMLALNATIDATRGDGGGPNLTEMASTINKLANESARARDDIGDRLDTIKVAANDAETAFDGLSGVIGDIDDAAAAATAAVERQRTTALGLAQSIHRAGAATHHAATSVTSLPKSSEAAGIEADRIEKSAHGVVERADSLNARVNDLVIELRA